jgi:hypothetical protein
MHMSYELRVNGHKPETFERPEDAFDRVRFWLRADLDCEPELRDTQTGHAVGPAASLKWRDELATRIGF